MTQEIKQRIEQLRLNKTPDGYKKTSVGVIPQDWEVVRFKKLFSRLTRRNTEYNKNVLTISAQYGLISQEEFFNKTVASENTENYFLLNKGDFAYNKSYSNGYPFGAIKSLTKYDKGIVSPLYICFSVSEENKFPEFYNQYFEAGKFNREINAYAQEGARNHGLLNIAVEDFFNSLLIKPPLAEQQKIAAILSTQDKVIELQQKRIDELKKLKKAYLSKMFPQKGSNVPELRFKGFTGNWEQRKLGEMGTLKNGMNFSKDAMDKGFPFVNLQNVFGRNVVDFSMLGKAEASPNQLKDYNLLKGDVIFVRSSVKLEGVGEAALVPETLENTTYSGFIIRFRDEFGLEDDFKRFVFKTDNVRTQIISQATNSANKNISQPVLSNLNVSIPKDKTEQQKIGSFFRKLDDAITLQSRKLDAEKLKKKSLMQLLLTGIVRVK